MTAETWAPIPEFPGYWASDLGRIASIRRNKWRVLKQGRNPNGYWIVSLWRDDRESPITVTVHRLITAAFIGPRPDGLVVRHLDGDQHNNAAANLTYGTVSENSLDTVRHGRHNMARKTHCKRGHEFTPQTTDYTKNGGRMCRTCRFLYRQKAVA